LKKTNRKDKSGTYNISSEKAVMIKELEMIISVSGKKLEIKYTTPKKMIFVMSGDISLAKNNLGYHPKF